MFFIAVSDFADSSEPAYTYFELISEKDNSKIYIKSKNWGMTGDHQITVISGSGEREFEVDSTTQLVFHGLEPFLYQVKEDSLILYVREKVGVPEGFKTNWVVKQNEIENPEMMRLRTNPSYKRM